MPDVNQVTDQYTLQLGVDDKLTQPATAIASSLDKVTKSAESAAAAVLGAGTAAEGSATKVTAASSAWDRVAARQDEVTAAAYRLKAAQEQLARTTDQANAALAAGTATQEAVNNVLQKQADNVERLAALLVQVRAATEGAAQAQQLWQSRIADGDELLIGLATSAASTAEAFIKGSAEAQVYGQSLDSMRARFDPLFAASKAYETEIQALNKAIADGAIPIALQADLLDKLNTKYLQGTDIVAANAAATQKAAAAQAEAAATAQKYAAAAQEAFNKQLGVTGPTPTDDYAKRAADIAAYGASLDALRAKFDPLFAASKAYEVELNALNTAISTGALPASQYNAALDKLNAAFAQQQSAVQNVVVSHGQAAFAVRQLGVQTVQFFSSLEAGQPFITAFIQQGHQIVDVALATGTGFEVLKDAVTSAWAALITPTGLVIAGVTAVSVAVAAIGYAAVSSAQQILKLQTTLRATRDDYISLTDEVNKAAKDASATGLVSTSEARTAGATIAGAPNFGGSQKQLADLIIQAKDVATVMGITLPEAAKVFAEALGDPAKVADDLAKKHWPDMTQALVTSITSMQRAGDVAGATAVVFKTLEDHAGGAASKLNPLAEALKKVADAMPLDPETGAGGAYAVLLQQQQQAAAAPKPSGPTPEELTAAARALQQAQEAFQQQAATAAKAIVDPTTVGQVQKYTDIITGLTKALDVYGERNASNAQMVDLFNAAISTTEKALRAARPELDQQTEAMAATAQGQRDVAAAYANGTDAVNQAQAYAKAYSDALTAHLTPGTAEFTDYVRKMSAALLDSAAATAALKGAQDSLDYKNQVALIEAQTQALILNTDAARQNVQAVKDQQALAKLPADQQAAAAAGQAAVNAANDQEKLAQRLNSALAGYKPEQIAQAKKDIDDFTTKLATLGVRTDANAAQWDKWSLGIKAADDKLANLNKTHDTAAIKIQTASDKLDAQIDAQNKLTVAWGQGGNAVLEITAQMKAEEQAITDHLTPGTQKYTDAVDSLTKKQLDLARAQAETKAQQDANDTQQQINLVQTETSMLLDNSDARTLLIQHMKDQYDIQKNLVGLSPEEQASLLAQKDALAKLTLEYQNQQNTLSYLSQTFSSAFDSIGQAITQTFIQGQGAAVNWRNVMSGVVTQVIEAFGKLAILNPIMNSLFGQNNPTLGSVFSLLGGGGTSGSGTSGGGGALQLVSLGGGAVGLVSAAGGGGAVGGGFGLGSGGGGSTGADATAALAAYNGATGLGVGGGAAGSGLSGMSLLSGAGSLFSVVKALFPSVGSSTGGFLSGITDSIGLTGSGGLLSGLTSFLSTPVWGGVSAADAAFASASSVGSGAFVPAEALAGAGATTIGSLIGGAGAGFGLGSLLGSFVQSSAGKTGPAPTIGAGLGALGGAAIGGAFFGPAGALVGGLLGGTAGGGIGGLIGPHPASPFSSTYVGITPEGTLRVGDTSSQLVDASAERAGALSDTDTINQIMAQLGVRINAWASQVSLNSLSGVGLAPAGGDLVTLQIGQNAPGGFQNPNKYPNLLAAFPSFQFSADDPLINNQIAYRSFNDPGQLAGVVSAMSELSATLKAVAEQAPIGSGMDQQGIFDATVQGVANDAVQAAVDSTVAYVTQTLPGLIGPAMGSLEATIEGIQQTYAPAIAQGTALGGYGVDELNAAQDALIAKAQAQAQQTVDNANATVRTNFLTAQAAVSGSPADVQAAALASFDTQAAQQRQQFSDQLTGLFGDAYAATNYYAQSMVDLDKTTAEQRLAIVKQYNQQVYQLAQDQYVQSRGLYDRSVTAYSALTGDPAQMQAAARESLAAQQSAEQISTSRSLLATYGSSYAQSPDFAATMKALTDAQGFEMALLAQQQQQANAQIAINSAFEDRSFADRYATAAATVSGSPTDAMAAQLQAFDTQAAIELNNLQQSLQQTYGTAYTTSQDYADKLAALEKAQGEERLALQKQFNDQATQSATASLQSLNAYALSLQTGSNSPLSPKAQLDLASRQFDVQSALAKGGDYTAIQSLQTYSDAYLNAAHTVFGSGMDYVQAFSKVIDTLATVATVTPDTLTASILQTETRTQTDILVDQLQQLQDEVRQLRLEIAQGTSAPARVSS